MAAPGTEAGAGLRAAPGAGAARVPVLALLLGLNVLLRLIPALRPLQHLDDLAIPDDAYLSLTLARNIARGFGPLYGLEPTNGFQPLYVFLMGPVYALLPHDLFTPIRIAMFMLIACDTVGLYFLHRMVERTSASRVTPALVALSWAFSPYAILTSLNTIETSLAFSTLAAVFAVFQGLRVEQPGGVSTSRLIGLGAIIGLATLARIDGWLLIPAVGWPLARAYRRAGVTWGHVLRSLSIIAATALVVYLPWLIYQAVYVGDLVPISGKAVRYVAIALMDVGSHPADFNWRNALSAAWVVGTNNVLYLVLVVGLGFLVALLGRGPALRAVRDRLAAHQPVLIFTALIAVAYMAVIGGSWHFARYFFPVALLLALAAGALIDRILVAIHTPRAQRVAVALLAVTVLAGSVAAPDFRRLYSPAAPAPWGFMRIGLWARDHFPAGTVIGAPQSGAIGYFANNLTIVNLDGVVNRSCYESFLQNRHLEYIRSTGIQYLIGQGDVGFFARQSAGYRRGDLTMVGAAGDMRTMGARWYVYRVSHGAGSSGGILSARSLL